jgi:hypothetical protein
MAEPVFMKIGMLSIMSPDAISAAYVINPWHQSVCVYVYPFCRYYATARRFLCGPYRIKGKYAISSSQIFLYMITIPVKTFP